ncbi:NAD-dependent epimerase/dehydratase family protein [Paenibacillus methanolicus]|uniref:Nucleoside-diphosphate-sugar epimerase n=1 Tax=Paenibacillus methanolicus TaxID=582686 RepID=A0A5S5BRB8_9BACL|nr:NAD-dependent epimerase/dehydratase family protein [Paenibacillus methanolicus]TYP69537.1 nucleoside-diphosphate-sugar epimerase [Paenibacillus methanolicus]
MNHQELHVIFGTGPLGKWTMRELLRLNKQVRLVNRTGDRRGVPEEVEVVAGNAYDRSNVTALTTGAAAVYQCAQPAYPDWVTSFMPMQQAIVDGTAVHGARLIVAENLYMYGMPSSSPFVESTPCRAHTRKGKVRQLMTEALEQAHREGKLRVARVRGSDFWGPDDKAATPFIFGPLLAGKRATLLGSRHLPHTFTYAPDFGKALAIAGTQDSALGEVWHVPSNPPVTQMELCLAIAAEWNTRAKSGVADTWLIRLLGLANPTMREMAEMMYQWKHPFVMDSSKFSATFGMQATPMKEAIADTIRWYRNHVNTPQSAPK